MQRSNSSLQPQREAFFYLTIYSKSHYVTLFKTKKKTLLLLLSGIQLDEKVKSQTSFAYNDTHLVCESFLHIERFVYSFNDDTKYGSYYFWLARLYPYSFPSPGTLCIILKWNLSHLLMTAALCLIIAYEATRVREKGWKDFVRESRQKTSSY